jgi:adenosine 3'-phospho 5'-phosphosulfate transporter B2
MGIFLYVVSLKVQTSTEGSFSSPSSSWIHRLLSNLSGYAIIFLPGYLIIKYIYRVNYIDKAHKGFLWPLIRACVYGQDGLGGEMLLPSSDPSLSKSAAVDSNSDLSFKKNAALLVYCFGGLQASYLMWGLLQEKIMTQSYSGQQFTDSQFLVFVNRILALVIAWVYLGIYERPTIASLRQRRGDAPLYKYSYCAFSNIMSSWFQYEALKFVSFPTQVIDVTGSYSHVLSILIKISLISFRSWQKRVR